MKIYFDMDGVLVDFDRGVLELCGITAPKQGLSERTKEVENKMWDEIRKIDNFYAKLKPLDEGIKLFNDLYSIYGMDVEILTGIPKESRNIPNASIDKINWVKENISTKIIVNTVVREDKIKFCKGKDYILIDDYAKNIEAWENAGGTGILFDDIYEVKKKINKIIIENLNK